MRITGVFATVLFSALSSTGCVVSGSTPGMVDVPQRAHPEDSTLQELARVQPPEGQRALLVVFPKNACTGSARMVLMDGHGTFYGSVGPGEGALLEIPRSTRSLEVVSIVEVLAARGTWSYTDEVKVPAEPNGLLLRPTRANTRTCGSGHYAYADRATKSELEAAIAEAGTPIRWLSPRRAEGQAWIDEHRARVEELLARR